MCYNQNGGLYKVMKRIIYFICSLGILAILACMAFIGLSGTLELEIPEFMQSLVLFYGLFEVFTIETFMLALPLLIGIVFSIFNFTSKSPKIIFLILELACITIICLAGFGVLS